MLLGPNICHWLYCPHHYCILWLCCGCWYHIHLCPAGWLWWVWSLDFLSRTNKPLMCVIIMEYYYYFVLFYLWMHSTWPPPVTGPCKGGSLGSFFVSADWQVRVLWSSGIVDRLTDILYVHTIPLAGCMDRRSCCIPFSYQVLLSIW